MHFIRISNIRIVQSSLKSVNFFLNKKTAVYGFWLNSMLGLLGIIGHIQYSLMGTVADNAIMLSDMLIGYVLYIMYLEAKKPVRAVKKVKRRKK